MSADRLIGRQDERDALRSALTSAVGGRGSLVLLSGEAGVGKTRLAQEVLAGAEIRMVRGAAQPDGAPYGPVVSALRDHMRTTPGGLDRCGPLRGQLAALLPELGESGGVTDKATLIEAIRCAFDSMVAEGPMAVLLDDLQWSDEATLEVLATLAPALADMRLLVVAAYRSDELSRTHPLRRLRHDLRRDRLLCEIALEPLTPEETGELAAALLDQPVSPALVTVLHDRATGNPFFVEELVMALRDRGGLTDGPEGTSLCLDDDVPLPGSVRDAVLLRIAPLSDPARDLAELAAVAGHEVDLEVLAPLGAPAALEELLAAGLLRSEADGRAAFRHPLARDAIYEDVPWVRRAALHRTVADALAGRDGDPSEVAAHWLAARDTARALDAVLPAIERRAAVHAYRDATRLGRRALDLWPQGERTDERIELLAAHAHHAELAGDLAEAARAQREVVSARRTEGAGRALADAERRIAAIYALQGDRPRALAARRVSAEAYAVNGLPGEAAAERLVIAQYLQAAGEHTEAAAVAATARAEALRADRDDLRARAMGLEGVAVVKGGRYDDGITIIREGLELALAREHTAEAAEVYQRLGSAQEIAGDYPGAADALGTALGLCERAGTDDALEQVCLSCMAYVLRELGDWDEAATLCRQVISSQEPGPDTLVMDGVLGAIEAWRGRPRAALPLLTRCLESTTSLDVVSMQCDSLAALAWLAAREGDDDRARDYCRLLVGRWERSEDHHYAVWGLRWSAGWLAQTGDLGAAHGCVRALSTIASSAGHPDALAALAYAIGETALAEGDADTAVEQFAHAVELHEGLHIPFERAGILLRAGAAFAAAGDRDGAVEHLAGAYRIARTLGAGGVAGEAAEQIAALGASVEEHLGVRAADEQARGGLSRREHEVLALVAEGLTNREVAGRLVLSTRTVDAHVRSILNKLRCRTRTEAVSRAAELGLVGGTVR